MGEGDKAVSQACAKPFDLIPRTTIKTTVVKTTAAKKMTGVKTITLTTFALAMVIGATRQARAQDAKAP
jgi:hypothetical protein